MYRAFKKIIDFAGVYKSLLLKSMAVSYVGAIFAAMQFWALMLVLDAVLAGQRNIKTAWMAAGIMLIAIAGRAACAYYSTNAQTRTGYGMVAEKRIHIGDRLRYIPMGYFNKNSLGNITAVVTTTLGDVENSAARCLVMVLGGFFNTLVLALFVTAAQWQVGLVAILGIVVYLVVTEKSQSLAAKSGPARVRAQETLVEAVLEYLQGMSVVRAFGLEKDNGQAVQKAIDESSERALGVEYTMVPALSTQLLVVKIFAVVIDVVTLTIYLNGGMSLTYCILMLIASFMIYRELEGAGNMSALLQMLDTAMDKANAIDDTPVMDIDGQELSAQDASITFDKVDFSYGGRKILDGVSLTIPAKTTTAVVGPSGGGKTTLCNLIARFWDVEGGSIRVGGRDVREYKLDSLMQNVSMVFQDVYLFQDTVENNIKFGKPGASHEEVVQAAKSACCHEFVMALPNGYDTVLGEGGGSLSGGEKQRLSIARAMLKDAPIVILDEATASVDPENEAELQDAIAALTHNKTIVMIAHRLKTVRNADQILVLDGGHIVQKGTHEELQGQKGLYADFLNARREAAGWKLA